MRKLAAALLGMVVLIPMLLLLLALLLLGLLWDLAVSLWHTPILPDEPPQAASDLPECVIVRVSDKDLWWSGAEGDWQERKH